MDEDELIQAIVVPALTLERKTDILADYIEKIAGILEQVPALAHAINGLHGRLELVEQTVFGPDKDEEGELVDV